MEQTLEQAKKLIQGEKKISIEFLRTHMHIDGLTAVGLITQLEKQNLIDGTWDIYLGGYRVLDPATRGTGEGQGSK